MQLESLRRVTGPVADRGRHPVQQLAHMLPVQLCRRVQALHLAQELYTFQGLRERVVGGAKRQRAFNLQSFHNLVKKVKKGRMGWETAANVDVKK